MLEAAVRLPCPERLSRRRPSIAAGKKHAAARLFSTFFLRLTGQEATTVTASGGQETAARILRPGSSRMVRLAAIDHLHAERRGGAHQPPEAGCSSGAPPVRSSNPGHGPAAPRDQRRVASSMLSVRLGWHFPRDVEQAWLQR